MKIPNGKLEASYRRRTDNAIAKKGQKDTQWYTKHYAENERLNNTNPTKTLNAGAPEGQGARAPLVAPVWYYCRFSQSIA